MVARGRKRLDGARARELRAEGLTWAEVGAQLAHEEGRAVPYQAHAVAEVASGRQQARKLARELAQVPRD